MLSEPAMENLRFMSAIEEYGIFAFRDFNGIVWSINLKIDQ